LKGAVFLFDAMMEMGKKLDEFDLSGREVLLSKNKQSVVECREKKIVEVIHSLQLVNLNFALFMYLEFFQKYTQMP